MAPGLLDLLVVPKGAAAGRDAVRSTVPAGPGPVVALLADASDARAAGAAAALLVARLRRVPCALLCLSIVGADRQGDPRLRPWAAPAARRLAASLRSREVPAGAAGRLVTASVAPGSDGARAADRALAAAASAGAAAVVAIGGPRDATLDALVGRCDAALVLLRPQRRMLAALAVGSVEELGVPASAVVADVRPHARMICGSGLAMPPDLRTALLQPLRAALTSAAPISGAAAGSR
jgi:hypothetical protein